MQWHTTGLQQLVSETYSNIIDPGYSTIGSTRKSGLSILWDTSHGVSPCFVLKFDSPRSARRASQTFWYDRNGKGKLGKTSPISVTE